MRALRVVGISEDGGEPSVVLEDSGRQERFTVPADEQLRAAARGDLTRLGQISIELESQLRPREIQARIRAGASVDQVAAAAGVPAQKIERFAYPVLLERSRTAEVAQRAHPIRADGPDSRMLGDVVAHTFGLRGQEYHCAEWDSWKGDDGRWVVALAWRAGRSDNRALWTFQPGAHGGTVTAIDEHAHDLVEGLPARPLRTVGPVIDISRADEQAPAEEGHELRAAASDIAARREVSDWSRVAPEPRRPEPRRQAARPESAETLYREPTRPGRADEPATEWPVPQRQSEERASARYGDAAAPVDGPDVRREDPLVADGRVSGADELPGMSAAGPAGAASPVGVTRADAAAGDTTPPTADADEEAPPSAAAEMGRRARADDASAPRPVATDSEATDSAVTAVQPSHAAQPRAAAVPSARLPQSAPADHVRADYPAPETGSDEAAKLDGPSTVPPTSRQAEPAPKRTRKGKPVMPSWDEVLLGVRSQR
jgi:DUF3071 family protein